MKKPAPHVSRTHFLRVLTVKQQARMDAGKLESSPGDYERTQDGAARLAALRKAEALKEERAMRKAVE